MAEKEYNSIINDDCLIGKKDYILKMIKELGINNVPKKLNKSLKGFGKDIYQMRLDDNRVIYFKKNDNEGTIICTYVKKDDKMPSRIRNRIIERLKILNG